MNLSGSEFCFLLCYTIINDGTHREWERERKSRAWKQQVVAVISNTVCVYISVYIKRRKKSSSQNISSHSLDSTRCKSHLHLLIPSRKPFHRQPVRNKWRVREMENDDDDDGGEKPQVFHSECSSVHGRVLYTTTSTFSLSLSLSVPS